MVFITTLILFLYILLCHIFILLNVKVFSDFSLMAETIQAGLEFDPQQRKQTNK